MRFPIPAFTGQSVVRLKNQMGKGCKKLASPGVRHKVAQVELRDFPEQEEAPYHSCSLDWAGEGNRASAKNLFTVNISASPGRVTQKVKSKK